MPNTCVKMVQKQCTVQWKTCVRLFTPLQLFIVVLKKQWVKPANLSLVTRIETTLFSTAFSCKSPLFEHYFYPLSTGPITRATNLIY